jgi:hypothetical protein
MIPDTFINLVTGILRALIELIPVWTPPAEFGQSWVTAFAQMVAWANGYFPLKDLAVCLVILVGVRVALFAWQAFFWVYDKIPFKAT